MAENQGILESIGGFVGGIGEHLGTGFAAVRDAERAKLASPGIRNANSEVNQLLQTYKAIDPSTQEGAEKRSEILSQIQQTPTFQKFMADAGAARNAQVNRVAATKQLSDLARLRKSGEGVFTAKQNAAIDVRTSEVFADSEFNVDTGLEVGTTTPDLRKRLTLSSLFTTGIEALHKSSKGFRATTEETQAFADKLMRDAAAEGVAPSAASVLFGTQFKEERGKEGPFKNDVLPSKSKASDFFGFETPEPSGAKPKKPIPDDEVVKKFDDFVQTGTADFPIDNTPKNFKALGITTIADQQQFQELEKAAPAQIDVQQIAQQNPEDFKRMLAALRTGKTPNGKKFTIKDALELMGNL